MKRQRGRGRKPGHQPNRAMESTGPDVKVRGPASMIYEKYMQLARDAASSGDRVMAENYQQHAEHYFRLMRALMPVQPAPTQHERFSPDVEYEGEEEAFEADDAEAGEGGETAEARAPAEPANFEGGGEPNGPYEREGGFRGRRRGRRNRYRPDGDRDHRDNQSRYEQRDGGGYEAERPPREPYEGRPERAPRDGQDGRGERQARPDRGEGRGERRERGGETPAEGFAGQTPAFLGPD